MAMRTILVDGDPILRRRSREVLPAELGAPETQTLIDDLVETMNAADGVGIAAPQVGVGLRVIIAQSPRGLLALVNPVITAASARTVDDEEGCLSVPKVFDRVRRHKSATVRALTRRGEPLEFRADNFFARIIQHEIDHLDGILFIDRAAEQRAIKA
jgi:peptide deformylase